MSSSSPVVIHNGHSSLKFGFAGNVEPNIIPSKISAEDETKFIDSPFPNSEEWNTNELLWQKCIEHLQCVPENHLFLMPEPSLNSSENRNHTAEIMFEKFNVAGLCIVADSILALVSSWANKNSNERVLTGTVIHSGDETTRIVPVHDGKVIASGIKYFPIAGREVTLHIGTLIKEKHPNILEEDLLKVAQEVKERYTYICPEISKEFSKYDSEPSKWFKQHTYKSFNNESCTIDIGYERFMGPELYFSPETVSDFSTPLPKVVHEAIQSCDYGMTRSLYKNIVLSGGSTLFKDLWRRVGRDVKKCINERTDKLQEQLKMNLVPIEVNVTLPFNAQRYAVWFGGSLMASTEEFKKYCPTKQQYQEVGPSILSKTFWE